MELFNISCLPVPVILDSLLMLPRIYEAPINRKNRQLIIKVWHSKIHFHRDLEDTNNVEMWKLSIWWSEVP